MSERYQLLAQVKHHITDVMTLTVEAETEEEAFAKARKALKAYPREHGEDGIDYCYVEHRVFDNTEVVEIENMRKEESA